MASPGLTTWSAARPRSATGCYTCPLARDGARTSTKTRSWRMPARSGRTVRVPLQGQPAGRVRVEEMDPLHVDVQPGCLPGSGSQVRIDASDDLILTDGPVQVLVGSDEL